MNLSHLPVTDGVRRRLEASLTRLSHAYVISGPSGKVNHALAKQIASAYVCTAQEKRPCGVCPGCKKAQNGIHPDIVYLTAPEDKQRISVEQVRQMRADAYIRPNEANRKVYVIEASQLVKQNEAQNALLKVLEEGPDYLAFLFVAQQPEQLLVTIRSRCELLSLNGQGEGPVSDEVVECARETARLLLDGTEIQLAEWVVGIENKKWERETVQSFLRAVEDALRAQLSSRSADAARLLVLIKQIQKACTQNVVAGNLLGWLAAGR